MYNHQGVLHLQLRFAFCLDVVCLVWTWTRFGGSSVPDVDVLRCCLQRMASLLFMAPAAKASILLDALPPFTHTSQFVVRDGRRRSYGWARWRFAACTRTPTASLALRCCCAASTT
jgi:hypothetical protein